jgi:hypothetical protein
MKEKLSCEDFEDGIQLACARIDVNRYCSVDIDDSSCEACIAHHWGLS